MSTALAALLALFPVSATAEAEKGHDDDGVTPYIEYMVGLSHMPDQTIRGTGSSSSLFFGSTDQVPLGYFVGGAVGARFLDAWRTEIQVGFRASEIQSLAVQGEPDKGKDSTVTLFSVLANAYYDFDLSERGIPVSPWLGIGIGWGMPHLDAQNEIGAMQLKVDDTDSVLVYNAMAGVSYDISDISTVSLGYRYVATQDIEVGGTQSGLVQRFDYEFDAHELYLGIRFDL